MSTVSVRLNQTASVLFGLTLAPAHPWNMSSVSVSASASATRRLTPTLPTMSLPLVASSTSSPPRRAPMSRARSVSLVKVEDVGESPDEQVDQSAYGNNYNADWVNHKGPRRPLFSRIMLTRHFSGAWLMHPCLVLLVKLSLDTLPGMTQQFSWTFVNLGYLMVSPSAAAQSRTNFGQFVHPARADILPHVPLGNGHPIPGEHAQRRVRRPHSLGANR